MTVLLRSAFFNLAFFALTIVMAVVCLPLLPWRGPTEAALRLWARAVLWLLSAVVGLRVRAVGFEHLPEGAAILAAKHQSAFDTVFWLTLRPLPAYVLKRELLWIPLYGWFAARAGMIPVDRAGGGAALRRMLRAARAALAAGRKIVIFPEGTRTAPGESRPWQPGVAALAATGAPVLPVATDSGRFWGRRAFLKRPGVLSVVVLPPLPAGLPRDEMLRQAQAAVEAESLRLLGAAAVENPVEQPAGRVRAGAQHQPSSD
ncbi:MAG: 1-acyl-sn-glycerol-3-phosphate acyltransferase [Acetobacteraceae bacterium]|nr:1-acyl-sn-glycerol-3-phosphate acyltransferase [Acetobacteraceae bacterium]MDW8399439.1 lysophospholipid acyltransferase family protein [Acetobacteraceae bacterium]